MLTCRDPAAASFFHAADMIFSAGSARSSALICRTCVGVFFKSARARICVDGEGGGKEGVRG